MARSCILLLNFLWLNLYWPAEIQNYSLAASCLVDSFTVSLHNPTSRLGLCSRLGGWAVEKVCCWAVACGKCDSINYTQAIHYGVSSAISSQPTASWWSTQHTAQVPLALMASGMAWSLHDWLQRDSTPVSFALEHQSVGGGYFGLIKMWSQKQSQVKMS